MAVPDYEAAWLYALRRLERDLPAELLYHGVAHTRDDVVPAAKRLAELEGVTGDDLHLLLTAAWYHDIGYIEQVGDHEMVSCRIAASKLPQFGFSRYP